MRVFALPTTSKRATIAHRGKTSMKRRHGLIENVCQRGSVYIVRHNFRQRFVEKNKSQGGTVVAWGLVTQLPSADNADHTVAVIKEASVPSAPLSTSTNNNMNTQHHVTERHSGDLRSSYTAPKCWQCRSHNEIAVTQGCRLQNLDCILQIHFKM